MKNLGILYQGVPDFRLLIAFSGDFDEEFGNS
jgi:hypothetical protein